MALAQSSDGVLYVLAQLPLLLRTYLGALLRM
jgi:hypothetical protein